MAPSEQCRSSADAHGRRPRILLGITGSVAAVKGPKLALRLADELKADVKVVLTRTVEQYFWKEGRAVATYDGESWRKLQSVVTSPSATPTVSGGGDGRDQDWRKSAGSISIQYAEEEWASYKSLQDSVLHIDLRNWADVCLIAPLSAHTLAKLANGLCDDLLTCCLRAWDFGQRVSPKGESNQPGKPVILAPAMNTAMWDHPLTRMQLEIIQKFSRGTKGNASEEGGVVVVEPAVKTLACGETGAGALAELDDIICAVRKCLVRWNAEHESIGNANNDASVAKSSRKESMKRALLHYAKQRFVEMKSIHDQQQSTGQSSSTSQLAAPISPTPNLIIEAFLHRLCLDSDSLLVDLGCGDARWLIAANKETQCRCLGIDVDEERLRIAEESIARNNLQEVVRVRNQDVFEFVKESHEFSLADVIIIYLFREAMLEMGPLIRERLASNNQKTDAPSHPKHIQILSVGFALTGWTSVYEEKINGIRVYLYSTRPE